MADNETGPRLPTGLNDLLQESFPLLAEDLRAARERLGISSSVAADCAELDPAIYRALEEGTCPRDVDNVGLMVSAAQSLGLEEVRFSYVDDVQHQYIKLDLSTDGPFVIFLDRLRFDVSELKEQAVYVSPYKVLDLVEFTGFYETVASRQPADKQLIELWTAAVFTLCLGRGGDYYVRLVRDDPPDAEVLEINAEGRNFRGFRLEITQHGSHSKDLLDVIGRKLRNRYQKGTIIVVLVEQAAEILINELHNFVRANNPYNLQIYVMGGSEAPGSFTVVPLREVTKPTPSETAWLEIGVNTNNASRGYCGYEGVVFRPPESRFLPPYPVFVKELELRREM